MLFLLPPSETKRFGGTLPSISDVAQVFGSLAAKREFLVNTLVQLSADEETAARVLKLSKKQLIDLELNRELWNGPTMNALQRYNGTLYDAIEFDSLNVSALQRAKEMVLIQSSLFGLISAADRIPRYRFSATTKLPGLNLKNFWAEAHLAVFKRIAGAAPIIDLRSKSYEELAPIPSDIESYWVEVLSISSNGETRALNHFNKKSKGEFIRACLTSRKKPETLADLKRVAKSIGFGFDVELGQVRLIIPGS